MKILPPLLLALGAFFAARPLPALAQSTSLSWQCQTPAQKPPSGSQCPVNTDTPLPVSSSPTPGTTQDVNITEVGGNAVTTSLPVTVESGVLSADQGDPNVGGTAAWPVISQPSSTSASGVAPSACSALCANLVLKASAGNLYSFEVAADSTLSAAAWWVMVYNATSAPTDGAVTPAKCYAMPLGTSNFSAAWSTPPAYFSTGITVGVSTAGCFTKTASTHAFISGEAK